MNRIQFLLFLLISSSLIGQDNDRKINFPDVKDYLTLKADLHIHTVFSDGSVWPSIRIDEAIKDGLDAISLTEHIEYQPYKADIPNPDRNRAYELALQAAKPYDLMIIPGAEITRKMPPGHANAIFITDANQLIIEDPIQAYEEANRQGAFVFWNHPDWINQKQDGIAELTDMHKLLIERKLLHGIEVVNDLTFSEEALEIALNTGITALGTSDVHGLVDWQYRIAEGGHRPITLVFAKERSIEAIKEALFDGRTVSWFDDLLVGKEEWVNALIDASLEFKYEDYIGPSSALKVSITNHSDANFLLKNLSDYTFQKNNEIISIPAQSKIELVIKTIEQKESIMMDFEVLSAVTGKRKHPIITRKIGK